MSSYTRALVAEVCGTFWFFFIGAGSILTVAFGSGGGLLDIALAHGITLAIAVSAFGALSGAHFNPAVTFGLAVAGRHPWSRVPTYWIAQLVGGVAAGFFDNWYVYWIGPLLGAGVAGLLIRYVLAPPPDLKTPTTA